MNERSMARSYFVALFDDWAGRISTALTLLALILSLLPSTSMPLLYQIMPKELWFVACFALFGRVNYKIYSRLADHIKELKGLQLRQDRTTQEHRRLADAQEARNRLLEREQRERRNVDFRRTGIFLRFDGATWRSGEAAINLVNEGAPARDLAVLTKMEGIRLGSRHAKTGDSVGLNFRFQPEEVGPIEVDFGYKDELSRERKHRLKLYLKRSRLEQEDVTEISE